MTVVIPTLARSEPLMNTLRDLSAQDLASWECIVVAQSEIDPAPIRDLFAGTARRLRILRLGEPNASLARNVGLLEARGSVVLFLDDDLRIPDAGFLRRHLRNYEDDSIPGVVGQLVDEDGAVREDRHRRSFHPRVGWLYFPPNYNRRCLCRTGGSGNLSVRREFAIAVGGMDAQFEKGAHREESDFCLRLTDRFGPLVFDPEASVIHLLAEEGGCRSWGTNRGIHPLHHVTGEWYFIRKMRRMGLIQLRDLPDHWAVLVRRQILNPDNRRSPRRIARALRRCAAGYRAAGRKIREGPRHIDTLTRGTYVEMQE